MHQRQQRKCMCLWVWCDCDTCQEIRSGEKLFGSNVFRHTDNLLALKPRTSFSCCIRNYLKLSHGRKWRNVCLSFAFECLYEKCVIFYVCCVYQLALYYANRSTAVSLLMSQNWAKITENAKYCFLYQHFISNTMCNNIIVVSSMFPLPYLLCLFSFYFLTHYILQFL